jgi:hypothetical protein
MIVQIISEGKLGRVKFCRLIILLYLNYSPHCQIFEGLKWHCWINNTVFASYSYFPNLRFHIALLLYIFYTKKTFELTNNLKKP